VPSVLFPRPGLVLILQAKLLREMKTMKAASRCFPMLLELGMKAEKVSDKVEEEMSALSESSVHVCCSDCDRHGVL